ncbi:MAG: OmpA family protein, partial [Spirochaetaceae bacterium]|nr:OmpA family protein [Spirochaetaceae bacterium]
SWTAIAEEVHLFRISGVMHGPYRGEIPASYEYLEDVWSGDKKLAHILIKYNIYLPINAAGEPVRLVSGRSEQNLYWDVEEGRPVSKSEEFEFLMMMSNGTLQEFRGRQEVTYRSDMMLDREEVSGSIRRSLENSPGITVNPVDDGILLSLSIKDGERVLFSPESAIISTDQYHRLEALKNLLSDYLDRDILITGHTAHFGTDEGRLILSRERAAAVAGILFPGGRIGPGRLYIRGAGSDEPAASEGSEAGRSANRRVEILILD